VWPSFVASFQDERALRHEVAVLHGFLSLSWRRNVATKKREGGVAFCISNRCHRLPTKMLYFFYYSEGTTLWSNTL
jgi:hypothetical protein